MIQFAQKTYANEPLKVGEGTTKAAGPKVQPSTTQTTPLKPSR